MGAAVLRRSLGRRHAQRHGPGRDHQPPPRDRREPRPVHARARWAAASRRFGAIKVALDPRGILNPGKLGSAVALGELGGHELAPCAVSILVVDVGTSGVRAAIVTPDGTVGTVHYQQVLPSSPAPGFVEFDAADMARCVLEVATRRAGRRVGRSKGWASPTNGRPPSCGTAPRASRWHRESDGRTCAPSGCASCFVNKASWSPPTSRPPSWPCCSTWPIPIAARDLCFGTVDSWVAWTLSAGTLHVTDATNAGGHRSARARRVEVERRHARGVAHPRRRAAPHRRLHRHGGRGRSALPGAPPICGIAGDQQASLVGQGCTRPGLAKATFGTGGMLDCCVGDNRPAFDRRGGAGTFPICAWRRAGHITWGVEAVMLSAGTCVEWLRDDLGIIATAAESDAVAASRAATPGTSGSSPPCSGWARRCGTSAPGPPSSGSPGARAGPRWCAPYSKASPSAAPTCSRRPKPTPGSMSGALRVDGGMSANVTFVQALADAIGRPVEISPVLEATTLGAAYLAGMALGTWADESDVAATWHPRTVVEPAITDVARTARRGSVARGPSPVDQDGARAFGPGVLNPTPAASAAESRRAHYRNPGTGR